MKKLIGNTISTISSSTANAVSSVSKQLDKTLAENQHLPPAPANAADKQYLRLPVESAKKLRWYDKADVAALTRQHVREKHMLLDTITALKKVMIRAGFTDSSLDEEARQLVSAAEAMRLADHGTESVLLIAVQDELEEVKEQRAAAEQQLQHLRDRLALSQTVGPPLPPPGQEQPAGAGAAAAADQAADPSAAAAAAVPVDIARQLQQSYAALEAAVADAAKVAEQVHQQELLLASDAEAAQLLIAAARQQEQQQGALQGAPQHEQPSSARAAGAQQQQEQQGQAEAVSSAASSAAAEPTLDTTSSAAASAAASADAAASAAVVKRYREFILQLEERCRASERGASLAAARVASLEESLAAAQQSLAATQQRAAAAAATARQQISHLEERLRTAEASAAASAATPAGANSIASAAAAEERAAHLQQQLAAANTQVSSLERRLSAAEGREASLMAELRSAEGTAAERDQLMAEAAALREQLGELGRERSQLQNHKQRVAGLESAKADLEGQLSGLAALVASLEGRLRGVTAQSTAASAAAELAAATAAKAQAAVSDQVAARLAAAGHNRCMWPPAARQEVEELEQQIEGLQAAVRSGRSQLEACGQELRLEQQGHLAVQQQLQQLEERLDQAEQDAKSREADLQSTLECCQAETDRLRDALQQLEAAAAAERQSAEWQRSMELRRSSSLATHGLVSAGSGGIIHSTAAAVAAAHGGNKLARGGSGIYGSSPRKWQEQNRVGGGSLYGVADSSSEAAVRAVAGSRETALSAVDLVYMKNILLKFLEAALAGKTAERDALLPAIAAVLQATPQEYAAMRKVLAATAPPATQMLSALGRLAQLAG